MKRILVPLDGSPLAEAILPVVEEWAKEEEAEVSLLRAVQAHRGLGDQTEAEVQALAEGEAYLKKVADRLERRGVKRVRWALWYDEPAHAIAEAAARNGADLISMATHGRGGLSRLLLGSVASGVVHSAQVPVLLIRGQSAWKPWATGKILVPLDGSPTSEAILPVMERLAGPRDLTILLFEAVEPPSSAALDDTSIRLGDRLVESMTFRREEAERYLAKVAEPLRDKGLRVERTVGTGRAAEAITAFAGRERVDLITMATHGRGGLGRLFFGSVAEGVLRSAAVPVLVFKAGAGVQQ